MERRPEITYLLLLCLSNAGALRVTMAPSPVTALRGQDVTITCHVSGLDLNNAIQLTWSRKLGNIIEDLYVYHDGEVRNSTPRYHVNGEEIWKGNAALRISGVHFADEGEYTCHIINTPIEKEGRSTLQVSAPPSVNLTPDLHIELGFEKSAVCEVTGFYPQAITILWVRHHKHSPGHEILKKGKFTTDPEKNTDGTFNITSQLILKPQIEDDGNQYSCNVTHRSLEKEIVRSFTLTVSERDDTRTIIWTVISGILLCTLIAAVTIYREKIKKYPPTLSDITGDIHQIDMIRATLTFHIMDYRPNDIEISVCLRRYIGLKEEELPIIPSWKSQDYPDPEETVNRFMEEEKQLLSGAKTHQDRPLQLIMVPVISRKRFGLSSCQCFLHITPSYDTDNGAVLSVRVTHRAKTSDVKKKLTVVGVAPKLMKITTPRRIQHGEEVTLTCPIGGFKPKALSITWRRKERDGTMSKLLTWNPGTGDTHIGRYYHNVQEEEHEDNSYSFLSALTLRATIMEDDGVTYICRTHHPATGKKSEKELNMEVTGLPTVSDITGNDWLTNMRRETLTCHISNFSPNDITIDVCLNKSGEQPFIIIPTWRSRDHPDTERPVIQNVGEEKQPLHRDWRLQLKMEPHITKDKFGLFSCQCLLHITPNYDTDNGEVLSVHVTHPAMTSPVSVRRILNVARGGPDRPDAAAAPPSFRDPTNQRGEARAQNRED